MGISRSSVVVAVKALVAAAVLTLCSSIVVLHAEPIRGAGSTFAAPVLSKWAANYLEVRTDGGDFRSPDWTVDYEPVGSLAGIMRLRQQEMDFAATDAPLPPDQIVKNGYAQFPIVFGGIAVVVNIEGVEPGRLRLTGPLLADIYLGKVQKWSDASITSLNPDLKLPDQDIIVAHRSDGSGSTFVFTQYLETNSSEWRMGYGADTLINWPVGTGAKGSQGIIKAIAATPGSIGYVEYGQVARARLAYALLRNKAGQFVQPSAHSIQAAVDSVDWAKSSHFFESLTDRPGKHVYPLAAATYAVLARRDREGDRIRRAFDFFNLAFEKGASDASTLGYVAVGPELVKQVRRYWEISARTARR